MEHRCLGWTITHTVQLLCQCSKLPPELVAVLVAPDMLIYWFQVGMMRRDCPKDSENVGLRCSSLDTVTTAASLGKSTNVIAANFRTCQRSAELAYCKEEKVESDKSQQFPLVGAGTAGTFKEAYAKDFLSFGAAEDQASPTDIRSCLPIVGAISNSNHCPIPYALHKPAQVLIVEIRILCQ